MMRRFLPGALIGLSLFIESCGGGGGSSSGGNDFPVVTITVPADGYSVNEGTSLDFIATATDTEDGNLGADIVWASDIDGPLGMGSAITLMLSAGTHTITAASEDSAGQAASDTISVTVIPMPADELFGGLWSGILTVGNSVPDAVVGISTDDGRFEFLLPDIGIQMSGTVMVSGTTVSGSGLAYTTQPGDSFPGGTTVSGFTFTGTLDSRNTLSGDWQIAAGDSGTFALDYDPEHERDASLSLVNDMWVQYDDFLNPLITFAVDANGMFSGQSALCTSIGQISVPDTRYNVYEWNVSITGTICPIVGDYAGLGALGDIDVLNDALIVLISNDARAFLLPLQRQP